MKVCQFLSKFLTHLCNPLGVIEFLLNEKETVEGLLVLLLEVVISDEAAEGGESLLAWGKGEGGSRVFLEI